MLKSMANACFLGPSADSLTAARFCSSGTSLGMVNRWAAPRCAWRRRFPSTGLAFPPCAVVPAVREKHFLLGKQPVMPRDPAQALSH